MYHKFIFIAIVYCAIIFIGFLSCEICGPFADKFKLVSMDLKAYRMVFDTSSAIQLRRDEIHGDTLDYPYLGFHLRPGIKLYYSDIAKPESGQWLMTANACSPSTPTSDEIITRIKIHCSSDFNSNYPIGSDLASAFDIIVPIEAYHLDYIRYDLISYLQTRPALSYELNLVLKSAPARPGLYAFTILYEQEGIDVDSLTLKSDTIWIR